MSIDSAISAVAVLDDTLRRGMYAFIRRALRPVTRDEAAASVGISRKLAAFHLDKLVAAGLLRSHYGVPGQNRKVGRAPKLYEPTDVDVRVSIPERRHELLADILTEAVVTGEDGEGGGTRQAAIRVAGQRGEDLGAAERPRPRGGRLGAERALTVAEAVLTGFGFEPVRESPTRVQLANCPFHPLAAKAPELVCALNQAFLAGLLNGMRATGVEAALCPRTGRCCVELRSADEAPQQP